MEFEWLQHAASRYDTCIRDSLNWMLDRQALGGGFLNTKVDPISGADYDHRSGLRGPDFTYGWIQGRGLEALVTFARHYQSIDPPLSGRLAKTARSLYVVLAELQARDGHIYFLYDKKLQAVRRTENGTAQQVNAGTTYTYSDAFAAKGLFAAACYLDPERVDKYLGYFREVIAAIENSRFQMDETRKLNSRNVLNQPGRLPAPEMILLGAAGLLHRNHRSTDTDFAERFINDVLQRYFDAASGLLLNVPGEDTCNVGHAIEFCGFGF